MLRRLCTAEASFDRILDLIKFGMAMAELIIITSTTKISSISENPFAVRLRTLGLFDLSWRRMIHTSRLHCRCDSSEFCPLCKIGEEGLPFLPYWVGSKSC